MNNPYRKFDPYGLQHLSIHLIEAELWDELEGTLCDLSFIEAKCAKEMTYELVQDYELAIAHRSLRSFSQMQKAVTLAFSSLIARPELAMQSVYNRLRWFEGLEPIVQKHFEAAFLQLEQQGFWIRAEAPLPGGEVSNKIPIVLKNAMIQSLSPLTNKLAVAYPDDTIEILDINTGKVIAQYPATTNLRAIALGKDENCLAYIDLQGKIGLVQQEPQLIGRKNETLLAYHSSGGILAVCEDHALVCWYPKRNETVVLERELPKPLIVLRPSLDGQSVLFIAGYRKQTIGVSTWDNGDWTTRLLPYADKRVVDACLVIRDEHVLLATIDRRLSILDSVYGERLAQLFYERHPVIPLRGAPAKCAMGIGPSQGVAFVATDSGQVAAWNWRQDTIERFESYHSPDETAMLVVMDVLPSSGALFVTTAMEGKILERSSPQDDKRSHQKLVSGCWLTTGNTVVTISEREHTVRWFSAEGLHFSGIQSARFPTALSQGAEPDMILLGDQKGDVWQLHLSSTVSDKPLLHLGEPVVSVFYRKNDDAIIAAGRNGDVACVSLKHKDFKKLWHTTGYQTRIKILSAGSYGFFWSLHDDEKIGKGKMASVVSLVQGVDQERVILSGDNLIDLAVSPDGATICVAGTDVQVLKFNRSQWRCVFRRETRVEKVCFLGKDGFLVVVIEGWLEAWQIAPDLPTVATSDLLPTQVTCLHAVGNRIVAGCRSGGIVSLSLRGIGWS